MKILLIISLLYNKDCLLALVVKVSEVSSPHEFLDGMNQFENVGSTYIRRVITYAARSKQIFCCDHH